ncbi:MAG: PilZ domain-containing protein [Pseudomonadota bacterium]
MRKYSRIHFDQEAWIETEAPAQRFIVSILDISLKGVLIELPTEANLTEGAPLTLNIPLLGQEVDIRMQAVSRHRHENKMGCEWVGIDLDSMTSLRRLLELNLADNDLLERELGQLCHG